jgi:hypothetical protein
LSGNSSRPREDVAVGRVGLDELVDGRRHRRRVPMNLCAVMTWVISSRMERFFASASSRHRSVASGSLATPPRPRTIVFSPGSGSISGSGPSASYAAQLAVPDLLQEPDRRLPADLLMPDDVGPLTGVLLGVAEDETHRGHDLEVSS